MKTLKIDSIVQGLLKEYAVYVLYALQEIFGTTEDIHIRRTILGLLFVLISTISNSINSIEMIKYIDIIQIMKDISIFNLKNHSRDAYSNKFNFEINS